MLLPVQTQQLTPWPNPVAQTSGVKCLQNDAFAVELVYRPQDLDEVMSLVVCRGDRQAETVSGNQREADRLHKLLEDARITHASLSPGISDAHTLTGSLPVSGGPLPSVIANPDLPPSNIRSFRGSQTWRPPGRGTSMDYTQTLTNHRLLASVGSVGDAYDNALAESFVDSFTTELIADRVWKTHSQLGLAIVEDVDWYNAARLHESLGDIPPVEYEQRHAERNRLRSWSDGVTRLIRSPSKPGPGVASHFHLSRRGLLTPDEQWGSLPRISRVPRLVVQPAGGVRRAALADDCLPSWHRGMR